MKNDWINLIKNIYNYFTCLNFNKNIYDYYDFVIEKNYIINRYYHNLNHINKLLSYSEIFNLTNKERLLLELSIWFHDIIYNPTKNDNEEQSAQEFVKFSNEYLKLDNLYVDIVKNMILATKHNDTAYNKLEKIICDLDLIELSSNNYIENSNKIKKEFSHLKDETWRNERIKFLTYFLNKEKIFYNKECYNTYEVKAKENLIKEIEYLKYIC